MSKEDSIVGIVKPHYRKHVYFLFFSSLMTELTIHVGELTFVRNDRNAIVFVFEKSPCVYGSLTES